MTSDSQLESVVADLAVELWRLEYRLSKLEDEQNSGSLSPLRESLERIQDRLAASGVELRLHDGEEYIDGLLLNVVHVENAASRLFVIETLQPTVVMNDRVLLHGHVVLSGRAGSSAEGGSEDGA